MSGIDQIKSRIRQLENLNISEADTCRIIIEPILQLLGYDIYDWNIVREQVSIEESSSKGNDGRVDYGLRINDRFVYMIEAKRLGSKSIKDKSEIKKAVDYCAHNDRPRFAVITDGRIWSIFDNQVGGLPSSRELITFDIMDEKNEVWLDILKPSFLNEFEFLCNDIASIKTDIKNEDRKNSLCESSLNLLYSKLTKHETQDHIENTIETDVSMTQTIGLNRFYFANQNPTGKKPKLIVFKDKDVKFEVNSWTEALFQIFREISRTRALDMAKVERKHGDLMFPNREINRKQRPVDVSADSSIQLFFEMNGSAEELMEKFKRALHLLAIPFDSIEIYCN